MEIYETPSLAYLGGALDDLVPDAVGQLHETSNVVRLRVARLGRDDRAARLRGRGFPRFTHMSKVQLGHGDR